MPQRDKPLHCYGTCTTCGKLSYTTRKDARRSANRYPRQRLNAYRCPVGQGWHLGHLTPRVIHGQIDRAALRQTPRPERTTTT